MHRCSRVFGCCHRHDRFGPRLANGWGFTPPCRCLGQLSLGVLPRSVHEMPVLLAAPNRSGLRPSFPVRAYPLLRLSDWSASLALPTARPTTPSADSCAPVGSPFDFPSSNNGTWRRPPQVSSIAFTAPPPDLQPWPLMEPDFAIRCPLVRPRMPNLVSVRQVAALLRTSFRRHLAMTPLCFASPSPPSDWTGDSHSPAIEHAGHASG